MSTASGAGPQRGSKGLQTRERLLGAAAGEFKRAGMAAADTAAIASAAGVAQSTFFFHFPTKEHVLIELETPRRRAHRTATNATVHHATQRRGCPDQDRDRDRIAGTPTGQPPVQRLSCPALFSNANPRTGVDQPPRHGRSHRGTPACTTPRRDSRERRPISQRGLLPHRPLRPAVDPARRPPTAATRAGQIRRCHAARNEPTVARAGPWPKKNWPELVALTSFFSVELPGIEPGS